MSETGEKTNDFLARERMLIGDAGIDALANAHVAVFGVGGVGGSAAEALVRAGIGEITVVDNDTVNITNVNRQIIATAENVGKPKVDACEKRFLAINPSLKFHKIDKFFSQKTLADFDFSQYDFVCDAIDSLKEKILLIKTCKEKDVRIISSMGTGNKLSPEKFEISDISKTSYCPLARSVRSLLKAEGIKNLTVVYSKEEPIKTNSRTPGSISFVPPAAGLLMASYIVKTIILEDNK